ncbi:hypothetical protein Tco_0499119 [Tanacetum coccineum]
MTAIDFLQDLDDLGGWDILICGTYDEGNNDNEVLGLGKVSSIIPIDSNISLEGSCLLMLVVGVAIRKYDGSRYIQRNEVFSGSVFLLGLLALAIDAACAFRAEEIPSLISCWTAAKVMADSVVKEEDGEQIRFLGGNSSSGTKKYQGSNSNDGGNTEDGVKIAGGVIGSGDEIELKEMLPDEAGK